MIQFGMPNNSFDIFKDLLPINTKFSDGTNSLVIKDHSSTLFGSGYSGDVKREYLCLHIASERSHVVYFEVNHLHNQILAGRWTIVE